MVVSGGAASPRVEAQLQEEPKGPSIPFVPDLAHSGPAPIANPAVRRVSHCNTATNDSAHIAALRRKQPPQPVDKSSSKRQINAIHGRNRRGRDPPGDPPGKRVKLVMDEEPIPMVVRSDPPGAAPCQVLSMFTGTL